MPFFGHRGLFTGKDFPKFDVNIKKSISCITQYQSIDESRRFCFTPVLNKFLRTLQLTFQSVLLSIYSTFFQCKFKSNFFVCCCKYLVFLLMLSHQWTTYRSKTKIWILWSTYISTFYCIFVVLYRLSFVYV